MLVCSLTLQPKATALLYTVRILGGTLGVSFAGALQLSTLTSALRTSFATVPERESLINAILHSKSAISRLSPDLHQMAVAAYAHSISSVWLGSAAFAGITFLTAFWVSEKPVAVVDEPVKVVAADIESGGRRV